MDGSAGDGPRRRDDETYDVFISYRQQDPGGAWVRGVLVERLRAAGLRVFIDYESFRLGAPLVLESGSARPGCSTSTNDAVRE
jgi:hypothetical protein